MRFGGHQTFSIREGWLFKGMRVLKEEPDVFGTDLLQDHLGVGKNMARAIQHWLVATGLASIRKMKGRKNRLDLTDFGNTVWHFDRYMLHPATWWLIHLELCHNDRRALTWNWFFNRFTSTRFERATAVESLRRYLQTTGSRVPTIRTLERDVSCMLRSYAEVIPREQGDPEDVLECPMVELGLMTRSRHSGFFRLNREPKEIPFPVFALSVSRAFSLSNEPRPVDISLTELTHQRSSPGRIFSLSADSMFEMVTRYEAEGEGRITMTSQAGERIVRIENEPEEHWVEESLSRSAAAIAV